MYVEGTLVVRYGQLESLLLGSRFQISKLVRPRGWQSAGRLAVGSCADGNLHHFGLRCWWQLCLLAVALAIATTSVPAWCRSRFHWTALHFGNSLQQHQPLAQTLASGTLQRSMLRSRRDHWRSSPKSETPRPILRKIGISVTIVILVTKNIASNEAPNPKPPRPCGFPDSPSRSKVRRHARDWELHVFASLKLQRPHNALTKILGDNVGIIVHFGV